jgi:hypothetical protein
MKRKAIPEGKDEVGKMKIPHENGGDSLTLKTTNIRELILSLDLNTQRNYLVQ